MGLLDKIFGSKNQKVLKKIQPLVNSINSLEEEYSKLTNEDLKKKRAMPRSMQGPFKNIQRLTFEGPVEGPI